MLGNLKSSDKKDVNCCAPASPGGQLILPVVKGSRVTGALLSDIPWTGFGSDASPIGRRPPAITITGPSSTPLPSSNRKPGAPPPLLRGLGGYARIQFKYEPFLFPKQVCNVHSILRIKRNNI